MEPACTYLSQSEPILVYCSGPWSATATNKHHRTASTAPLTSPCTSGLLQVFPGLWTHQEQAYSNTLAAVKESVERMGLQYIDLMLLHAPGESAGRPEAWRALEDAQAQVTESVL
jgi:aryl-alcohol dehydrogenase-like predicted oxidoreductase